MKAPSVLTVLSVLFAVGYFGVLAGLMFHLIPAENREMLNQMLGLMSVVMLKIIEKHQDKATPPASPTP